MAGPFGFDGPVEVIAHRGYSAKAPENTIAALELALDVGADALEFDVHAAADGTPHLFHDSALARTANGRGRIRNQTPAALAALDAGSWFDPRFAGEPVPTLEAALARVADRAGRVYPEIKGYRELADVDRVLEAVTAAGMLDRAVFISMDWGALSRLREHTADAAIGYIVDRADRTDEALDRAAGDAAALVDFDAALLLADEGIAARAAAASIELATWTVNRTTDAARLYEMGVRRLTTNEVEALLDWKATL